MRSNETNLINKGHYSISIPVIGIYATAYWMFGLGFLPLLLTTIVAWLFWAVVVPKWKLNSIREIESTESYVKWYSTAISHFLIWHDSNWFTKTEFWNKNDKREYEERRDSLLNISTSNQS